MTEKGKVKLKIKEVSASRIDVIYPHEVTWNSAWRLGQLASRKDPTFRILGDPQGIMDEPGATESDTPDSTQMEPPPSKKQRWKVGAMCGAESAQSTALPSSVAWPKALGGVVSVQQSSPQEKERASATAGSNSRANASTGVAASADMPPGLPLHLLPLKWEDMNHHLSQPNVAVEDSLAYDVDWENRLDKGSFGEVFPARGRDTNERVVVKVFCGKRCGALQWSYAVVSPWQTIPIS